METTILEKMTVCNALGLHARPAAQLVHIAGKFKSAVSIRRAGGLLSGSTCGLFPCTLGLLPAGDPGPFR